ncbi:MAG: hypothetical protein WCX31_07530 [Salinivirgaceae bacterium]
MKNALLFFTVIIALLTFNYSNAQNDYKKGYIITFSNDTIYGSINLKSNTQNSKECEFKKSLEASSEIFSPEDLLAYRIEESKYYVSKNIQLDSTLRKVFLEFLLDGIVDLYYYKESQKEYFFLEKDGTLYRLNNNKKEIYRKEGVYVQNSNQYIGVLNYTFQDSPEMSDKIKNTNFDYKSLINITKDYHESVCNDYECIDYSRSTKRHIYIEPTLGIINSWMGIQTSNDYSMDTKPVVGVNFRFSSIISRAAWNYTIGANYSTNDFYGDYTNGLFYEGISRIDMNYSILRIPLIVDFTFPGSKFHPLISLGYNNVIIINPSYKIHNIVSFISDGELVKTETSEIRSNFRTYQYGFMVGTGFRYSINQRSQLTMKADFEYRMPSSKYGYFLDYHYVLSMMLNLGYSYSL